MKVNSTLEMLYSSKRIECLLEELIFQQIIIRFPKEPKEFWNDKFKTALKDVDKQLGAYVRELSEDHPPSELPEKTPEV